MANLNRIILVGTVSQDPEARLTVDGRAVTKFQLSVNRWTKPGAEQEVDLVDIVTWGRLAETCGQHLKKGKTALVEGRIQNRSFTDESGQRKWVTEIVARNMQMLGAIAVAMPEKEDLPVEQFGGGEDLPF